MNDSILHTFLKGLRLIYKKLFIGKYEPDGVIKDIDTANEVIYNLLSSGKPCMIARYGGNELNTMINVNGVSNNNHDILNFIKCRTPQWWWNKKGIDLLSNCAGFFPSTEETLKRFGCLMMEDSKELDILGSCWDSEIYIKDLINNTIKIKLVYLEPWHSSQPWSRILKDKRILVIHPFAESINDQYKRRDKIFKNPNVLPAFKSLRIIPAVQSLGGGNGKFKDWFEALDWMKSEMDREPYDIVIIGCGAYGFPLAAHAKRTGHQGIHLGGATQLLFGITGNRWIKEYGMGDEYFSLVPKGAYKNLMNEYWIRPDSSETPESANNVEGACYW